MSERYQKVFTGAEDLYVENAPIVIRASALLKDTETGKMIAQIKMKNVSGKTISYVKISITQLDSIHQPIDKAIAFEYLDLSVKDTEEFGAKKPILLPKHSTRSFNVGVSHVAFADGTVWSSDNNDWHESEKASFILKEYEILKSKEAEETYREASTLSRSHKKEDIQKAISLFTSIQNEKNVSEEIRCCQEKMTELELKKIATVVLCVCFLFALLSFVI